MIRPSTKSSENLVLTWKFYHNSIVHLEITKFSNISGKVKYQIGKENYENLDDLMRRCILKSNSLLNSVISHPKFRAETEKEIIALLKEEKAKDPTAIPYAFGCFEYTPQYVVLFYLFARDVDKEYVKIRPDGLFFHNVYFSSAKMLVVWFKENLKTVEYQTYFKTVKPPFCGKNI